MSDQFVQAWSTALANSEKLDGQVRLYTSDRTPQALVDRWVSLLRRQQRTVSFINDVVTVRYSGWAAPGVFVRISIARHLWHETRFVAVRFDYDA